MIGTLPRGGLLSCLQDMALFCNMLMKGGQTLSGDAYLTRRTVSSLWCDWLQLRCVRAERRPGSPITMPGWSNGPSVGWSPLGHVRRRDGCLFMGGWSTSWAIYPKWQLATLVLHQSLIWFTVPAWCERRDELDGVVEAAKRRRGRARVGRGGTARKAQATQGAKDTRGARGAAASRRPLAARMGRRTRAAEAGARKDGRGAEAARRAARGRPGLAPFEARARLSETPNHGGRLFHILDCRDGRSLFTGREGGREARPQGSRGRQRCTGSALGPAGPGPAPGPRRSRPCESVWAPSWRTCPCWTAGGADRPRPQWTEGALQSGRQCIKSLCAAVCRHQCIRRDRASM
ncbi:unnamed protein product [Prorocentrum cordatum]|uniref:Uncharacterized protein n=1 Tax=Prorocentrum cordatum TaxID=2364126 RepID=A0ABN9THX3_9DINO|nr:unnamed protein product [Polarella glacialis]